MTRDEVVDRTYDNQFASRFTPVLVIRKDIAAIVDQAAALSPVQRRSRRGVMSKCLLNIDKASAQHDQDSIT